jgi:alpha-tubulin suppressor-like RCC1 family protein
LGCSIADYSKIPIQVNSSGILLGKKILQISSGVNHVCVIADDYKTYCWGYNLYFFKKKI